MGLLLMDTRDHFSVTEIKLFKNERRIPQPQVKSDSAKGNPPIQHGMTQSLAHQGALTIVLYNIETNRAPHRFSCQLI